MVAGLCRWSLNYGGTCQSRHASAQKYREGTRKTDQSKSPLQSVLVPQQLGLVHVVGVAAQNLRIVLELPKAFDGLGHATSQLRLAIGSCEEATWNN